MVRGKTFLPVFVALLALTPDWRGAAFADREQLSDAWPAGNWIFSFYLPDSYLPKGFYYDPNGRHFIFQTVDPGCDEAHCRRYFIGPSAYCANYSLSAKPGETTAPMGYGRTNFTPRTIGDGIQGYWNENFRSESALQSTFVFKIGSCVMGLYIDAGQASPKRGPKRFARPSEAEVLQTYQQFHAAFGRYIADRGWMKLEGSRKKPDFSQKAPPSGNQTDIQEAPPPSAETESPISELTPAEIAAVAGVAGGTALLGSLLLLGASGVRRDEVIEAIRELLRGRVPEDPYEAWKKKYEALGWRYSEKNGVATFDPVDGARNEAGEVWSSAKDGFVREGEPPPATPSFAPPKDGDVNKRGEVWSSFSGGYVERKTYEQDMASRAALAEKDRRDFDEMARGPDADVAELHRKIAETRQQGEAMHTYFKARDQLLEAVGDQRIREGLDAAQDEARSGLFENLSGRLLQTPADYRKGLEGLVPLADVIGNQMRPDYTPTYTYLDAMHDTVLQTGALALDAMATKGIASSAVNSGLAMRDAARAGADTTGVLTAGVKAAVTDYLFGKAVHLGAGYAGDAWRAARSAVTGAAESAADALGQTVRHSNVASDLVEQMKHNFDTLEKGVHRDASGRMRASITDVLEVQKNPHQVRALKQGGSLSTQEAFNNTLRNEVYKPHDQMLLERLRQTNPELADKKLMVHEFRTPGKSANPINTDRDFRVLMQNNEGKWVEVPKTQWEKHSNDVFGELTYFDRSKCPQNMTLDQQKAWWAEQHGHTPTDRAFREASRDYSDQAIDLITGRRTQTAQPRIADLKDIASGKVPPPAQPVKLADPQALAQQFRDKVDGNLRRGDPFEAIAQAQKGVDTLDTVRKAYTTQGLPAGELPGNLRQAMDLVKQSNLPVHPDAGTLHRLENDLGRLGFSGLDDFSHKLSSQFEGLKWSH